MKEVIAIIISMAAGGVIGFRLACIVIGIMMDEPHNPD